LAQERAIADALADVLELVHIAMASGTTIVGGLDLVADRGPVVVREAMGQLLDRHRTGEPLAVVLRSMTTTIGPAYQTLALVLIQSDREGSPLVALLQRLADEARAARRRQSEERLRRLPVQLLFPLVLCALPAVVIGAVVPLVISSMRRL
jgi:tight adherence protein C